MPRCWPRRSRRRARRGRTHKVTIDLRSASALFWTRLGSGVRDKSPQFAMRVRNRNVSKEPREQWVGELTMPLNSHQRTTFDLEKFSVVMYYHVKDETLKIWSENDHGKTICHSVTAVSGGGRGVAHYEEVRGQRKWVAYPDGIHGNRKYVSWDPATRPDSRTGRRGGPIPSGWYRVEEPKHNVFYESDGTKEHVYSSALIPYSGPGGPVINRRGFYIHGQGQKGSDGCIVPTKPLAATVFQWIKPPILARGAGWLLVSDQKVHHHHFIIHKIVYHQLTSA